MENEHSFFYQLIKYSCPKKKENNQIAFNSHDNKSGLIKIDNEWKQEYEIIYKSYALER